MRLGTVLKKYRSMVEKTTRQMAGEIGISPATYSRIERGELMDAKTLVRIFIWLTGEEDPENG